jgi:hypothetical protein
LNCQALLAEPSLEDHIKAAQDPDYYTHVVLKGIVKQMVFPGPPNFHSVEEGNWAEPRTIYDTDGNKTIRYHDKNVGG